MAETNVVDAYLAALPDEMRTALERIREVIRAVVPGMSEVIAYGLPTFKHKGKGVVALGAWKNHLALYPMSYAVMAAHKDELAVFEVSKGTVRFKPDQLLGDDLIRKIVLDRVAENDRRLSDKANAKAQP